MLQYGRDSVTLTVQWQPPQYDGGAPVNYTITVSPGLSPVITSGTSVPVTVPYNVIHTVSIVATNCNGSSSAVMVTIPAIGQLFSNPISTGNVSVIAVSNPISHITRFVYDWQISSNVSVIQLYMLAMYKTI